MKICFADSGVLYYFVIQACIDCSNNSFSGTACENMLRRQQCTLLFCYTSLYRLFQYCCLLCGWRIVVNRCVIIVPWFTLNTGRTRSVVVLIISPKDVSTIPTSLPKTHNIIHDEGKPLMNHQRGAIGTL